MLRRSFFASRNDLCFAVFVQALISEDSRDSRFYKPLMTIGIHQLIPVLEREDAIGNYVLSLRDFLKAGGYDSRIFVFSSHGDNPDYVLPYRRHREFSGKNNISIFHTAIASPLTRYFQTVPDRKILIHHNVTPARFLAGWDRETGYLAFRARRELADAAEAVDAAVADSAFNARELEELGYRSPTVIPLIFNRERLEGPADEKTVKHCRDGKTNVVFVGRISPNKKIEDVIRVFAGFQKNFRGDSRLILAGNDRQFPAYTRALKKMISDLNLKNIRLTGKVPLEELRAYYRTADAFICMSGHEGFGVPLLEAMFFRVPIVARALTAVPETLGEAGIMVKKPEPVKTAALIDRITTDPELRKKIIPGQDRRLEYFQNFPYRERWKEVIEELLGKTGGEAEH